MEKARKHPDANEQDLITGYFLSFFFVGYQTASIAIKVKADGSIAFNNLFLQVLGML